MANDVRWEAFAPDEQEIREKIVIRRSCLPAPAIRLLCVTAKKYLHEFIDFAAGANRTPIGFYQAYPGLSVQDIHT